MAVPPREKLIELYHEKEYTIDEIADEYNRAYSTVHEWLRKKGVTTRQRGGPPSELMMKQRRIHMIRSFVPCSRCGTNTHPAATDFHHVNGDKYMNVSDMKTCSWDKIAEEIKKCKILCANCHRVVEDEKRR